MKNKRNTKSINENEELNSEEKKLVVDSLHRVLKPFLLRRIKSDVIADLPNKVTNNLKKHWWTDVHIIKSQIIIFV